MSRQILFSNSEYVASHGRNPRGRGSWVFEYRFDEATTPLAKLDEIKAQPGIMRVEIVFGPRPVVQIWTTPGTLMRSTDAVRKALRMVFPRGFYYTVEVAP